MIAKMPPVRYERLSTLRRIRVYPAKGRSHCITPRAAVPAMAPPGRRRTSIRASPPSTISPACRARPLSASTSGAPIRKIRNGGTAVPGAGVPETSTAVWVTLAASRAQRANGLRGYAVQRPRTSAPAAVTRRGTRSVMRTTGISPSEGRKNARMMMGRKYATFSTLAEMRIRRIHHILIDPAPMPSER